MHTMENNNNNSQPKLEPGMHAAQTVASSDGGHAFQDSMADMRTNIIVNYLPQGVTQEDFRAIFANIGLIESCKLIRDRATGQSLGYGFVNYVHPEDAQSAVNTLNGLPVQSKIIKVSFARPSSEMIKGANLYVSGLPKTMKVAELEALFQPFGQIIASRMLTDQITGSPRGVGFVRFDKKNQAEMAIEKLNGAVAPGGSEPLCVKFANNPGGSGASPKSPQVVASPTAAATTPTASLLPLALLNAQARRMYGPIHHSPGSRFRYSPLGAPDLLAGSLISAAAAATLTAPPATGSSGIPLFVYNLSPEIEEAKLWQLFGPFGAVLDVKVVRDQQNNRCKGYAFVTMLNYEEALAAVASLDGFTFDNRQLQVSFKTANGKRPLQH